MDYHDSPWPEYRKWKGYNPETKQSVRIEGIYSAGEAQALAKEALGQAAIAYRNEDEEICHK